MSKDDIVTATEKSLTEKRGKRSLEAAFAIQNQ